MVISSPAKINLGLDITGKRPDGYHEIYTIMQTVSLYDEIHLEKAEGISLTASLPYVPADSRNLAWRAAEAFFRLSGIEGGVSIHLEKVIPVGAGLGGGSSNAAAVLSGLCALYGTRLPGEDLARAALALGADVPFFLTGGACEARGVGEVLAPLETPFKEGGERAFAVIVKPSFSVSTRWVYETLRVERIWRHPRVRETGDALCAGDLERAAALLGNVLENVTLGRHPQIKDIKKRLRRLGAAGALMSGSGSAVFGLFGHENAAHECAAQLKKEYEQVFVTSFV